VVTLQTLQHKQKSRQQMLLKAKNNVCKYVCRACCLQTGRDTAHNICQTMCLQPPLTC